MNIYLKQSQESVPWNQLKPENIETFEYKHENQHSAIFVKKHL